MTLEEFSDFRSLTENGGNILLAKSLAKYFNYKSMER